MRLVLNEKIKPISDGVVLSLMLFVTEQYAIGAKNVGQMKYTANDGCFHRHIETSKIQNMFWLRN